MNDNDRKKRKKRNRTNKSNKSDNTKGINPKRKGETWLIAKNNRDNKKLISKKN